MFSNLSSSSISLATVTPSLVMRGAPKLLSSTTLRPLGPSVTRTALANVSTPRSMRSRASVENFTSFAAISVCSVSIFSFDPHPEEARSAPSRRMRPVRDLVLRDAPCGRSSGRGVKLSGDHAHDVGLLHDQEFVPFDLDLGARPLAEQHAVADLQIDWNQLASLVAPAGTNGGDFALARLLLRGVGDDDAALGLFLGIDAFHDHPVVQGTKLEFGHGFLARRLRAA